MTIRQFANEYEFLSLKAPVSLDCEIDGSSETFPSVLQAFYAHQVPSFTYRNIFSNVPVTDDVKIFFDSVPDEFKRKLSETKQLQLMEKLLWQKFDLSREGEAGAENFAQRLLSTGYAELLNGSFSNVDLFWGIDLNTGEGKNYLGRLLMHIRYELVIQDRNYRDNNKLQAVLRKFNLPEDLIKFEEII